MKEHRENPAPPSPEDQGGGAWEWGGALGLRAEGIAELEPLLRQCPWSAAGPAPHWGLPPTGRTSPSASTCWDGQVRRWRKRCLQSPSGPPAPGFPWGLRPHSQLIGRGAQPCVDWLSQALTQRATVAHADFADGGGNAPPHAALHYSGLACIPKQGVTRRAAPSPARVPRRGGPGWAAGGTAGARAAALTTVSVFF